MTKDIELINFSGNTRGIEKSLKTLDKLFKGTNDSVTKVTEKSTTFNNRAGKLTSTIKVLTESGKTYTATLKRMKNSSGNLLNEWKLVRRGAVQTKEAIKTLNDNTAKTDAKLFKKVDAPKLTGDLTGFDNKSVASIRKSEDAIANLIEKVKFTRKEFKDVSRVLKKDFTASFTGAKAEAAKAARAINNLLDTARVKADKLAKTSKGKTQKDFNRDADAFAKNDIGKLTGNLIGLGPEQVANVEKVKAAIDRLIRSGQVSRETFNKVAESIKRNFRTSFEGDEQKAAIAFRNLQRSMLKTGETGETSANKILLSWKQLARIFAVQNIHLAVTRIISSFGNLIKKTTELDVKIAEISTIAGDATFNTDEWRDSIRKLSNEFGLSSIDTATAAYQALSNQVADGTRVFGFLTEAAQFARVTNSTLEESTNLLSSALNVYGEEGLTAARASAVLFKTIELGRVRASELQNDFGSMAILGGQLGITIEELTGSFSSLTIQGVNSSKAITLMRAVMLKLVRPTDAMKNLIKSWGVANAEAAIQTFGFQGVLQRLNKVALKGGVDALGEVAGRLRTTIGLVGFTGKSFNNVTDSIIEIEKTSVASFEKAKNSIKDAVGVRAQKEVQKFFNTFESQVGLPLVELLVTEVEKLGSLDSLTQSSINNLKDLFRILSTPIEATGNLFKAIEGLTGISSIINSVSGKINTDGFSKLFDSFSIAAPIISVMVTRFIGLKVASALLTSQLFKLLTTSTNLGRTTKLIGLTFKSAKLRLGVFGKTVNATKSSLNSLKSSATSLGTSLSLGFKSAKLRLSQFGKTVNATKSSLNSLKLNSVSLSQVLSLGFKSAKLRLSQFGKTVNVTKFSINSLKISATGFTKVLSLGFNSAKLRLAQLGKAVNATKSSINSLKISAAGLTTVLSLVFTVALEASFAYERSLQKITANLKEVSKQNAIAFNKLDNDAINNRTLDITAQDKLISQKYLKTLANLNVALDSVLKSYKNVTNSNFNLDIDSLSNQLFGETNKDQKDLTIKFLFEDIKKIQKEVLAFEKSIDKSKFSFKTLLEAPDSNSIKQAVELYKKTFGNSDLVLDNKKAFDAFNLTTGTSTQQLGKLYKRFLQLEVKARGDQRLGLIESAKEGFKDADTILDKFISKVDSLKGKLKSALQNVTDRLNSIDLNKATPENLKSQLQSQEALGLSFLRSGELEKALDAFKSSDKILSSLNSKGKELSNTFGIRIGEDLERGLLKSRKRALSAFKLPEVNKGSVLEGRVNTDVGNARQVVANNILKSSLALQKSEAAIASKIKEQLDLSRKLADLQKTRSSTLSNNRKAALAASNTRKDVLDRLNKSFQDLRDVGDSLNSRTLLRARIGKEYSVPVDYLDLINNKFKDIQDKIANVRLDENLSDADKDKFINEYYNKLTKLSQDKILDGLLKTGVFGGAGAKYYPLATNPSDQFNTIDFVDNQFDNIIEGNPLDLLNSIKEQGKALEKATNTLLKAQNNINVTERTQPAFESKLDFLVRQIQANGSIQPRQTIQRAQTVDQRVDVGGISFEINNTTNTDVNFNQLYGQIAQRLQRDVRKGTLRF
jgi:TP901 family phage tail tape measure protein